MSDKAYDLKTKAVVAQRAPYGVAVEAGKTYYFCTCGASKNQPWCDGSHNELNKKRGSTFRPTPFKAEASETKYFCGCKQSRNMPFCDGSHSKISKAEETASKAGLAKKATREDL